MSLYWIWILLIWSCLPVALVFVYLFVKGLYNLHVHPLKSYPGPWLARASRLYYIYYQYKGILPFHTKKLHDIYGDVVRIAPSELSYDIGQAWNDIYGHRSASTIESKGSFIKDDKFYTNAGETPSIVTAGDADHKRFRRVMAPAFSSKSLSQQEPLIIRHVNLFISQLHKRSALNTGGVVDIVRWFNFTTFDLIGDLTFGESFGCLEKGELHPWIAWVFRGIKESCFFQGVLRIPGLLPLLKYAAMIQNEAWKKQYAYSAEMAKKRLMAKTSRPDFMTHIIAANDKNGLSEKEIMDNAQVLVIAGSETTATALSGAIYHLCQNPAPLQKLCKEIRSAFTTEEEMTIEAVSQLPYLGAVIEESLRMYPPLAGTMPRTSPGDIICGQYVPSGTAVGVSHWSFNQSSKNWRHPSMFIPERWLPENENEQIYAGDAREYFNPFSYGPRNCIGTKLAYAEMRQILARLLWNFDVEMVDSDYRWVEKQKIYIVWEKIDLPVRLRSVNRTLVSVEG